MPFLCVVLVITFRLVKPIFFSFMIINYNFNFGPWNLNNSHTLKNSLELLITSKNFFYLLRSSQGLSYVLLMVWSLLCLLLDPNLCGYRVIVLITNYGVPNENTNVESRSLSEVKYVINNIMSTALTG